MATRPETGDANAEPQIDWPTGMTDEHLALALQDIEQARMEMLKRAARTRKRRIAVGVADEFAGAARVHDAFVSLLIRQRLALHVDADVCM